MTMLMMMTMMTVSQKTHIGRSIDPVLRSSSSNYYCLLC